MKVRSEIAFGLQSKCPLYADAELEAMSVDIKDTNGARILSLVLSLDDGYYYVQLGEDVTLYPIWSGRFERLVERNRETIIEVEKKVYTNDN